MLIHMAGTGYSIVFVKIWGSSPAGRLESNITTHVHGSTSLETSTSNIFKEFQEKLDGDQSTFEENRWIFYQ